MISEDKRHAKLWCCEEISKIENYEQAINDKSQIWVCHHRLELHPDGSIRFTEESLQKLGLYENRPACELIFLPFGLHSTLHNIARKEYISFVGNNNPMFGKSHTSESKQKISENRTGKGMIPKKNSRWAKYDMTRDEICNKLNLTRKQVEQMDNENKLMEVLWA